MITHLKFGDIIQFRPNITVPEIKVEPENIGKIDKETYTVVGIYIKTLTNGSVMLIDCLYWNGNFCDTDGIVIVPKKKVQTLRYPSSWCLQHYFGLRKRATDKMLYSRDPDFAGLSARDELKIREIIEKVKAPK